MISSQAMKLTQTASTSESTMEAKRVERSNGRVWHHDAAIAPIGHTRSRCRPRTATPVDVDHVVCDDPHSWPSPSRAAPSAEQQPLHTTILWYDRRIEIPAHRERHDSAEA